MLSLFLQIGRYGFFGLHGLIGILVGVIFMIFVCVIVWRIVEILAKKSGLDADWLTVIRLVAMLIVVIIFGQLIFNIFG
jgi:hypothetical protein